MVFIQIADHPCHCFGGLTSIWKMEDASIDSISVYLDTLEHVINAHRNSLSILQQTLLRCSAIYVCSFWAKSFDMAAIIIKFSSTMDFLYATKLKNRGLTCVDDTLQWLDEQKSP